MEIDLDSSRPCRNIECASTLLTVEILLPMRAESVTANLRQEERINVSTITRLRFASVSPFCCSAVDVLCKHLTAHTKLKTI